MPPSYLRSFSTPAVLDDGRVQIDRQVGVVTRICSFKYGFIQTPDLRNIFFHFSELSDEAKAVVEPGCRVQYKLTTNEWTTDKKMKAIAIEVISTPDQNVYKDMKGVVHRELGPRGFGFIQCENTTYFFPSNELVADEESNKRGNTARAGDQVVFDASWNHKYNPPKPYATHVRLVPSADDAATGRTTSVRTTSRMNRSNSAFVYTERSDSVSPTSTGSDGDSDDSNSTGNGRGISSSSWRVGANTSTRDNRSRTHARGSSLASLIPPSDSIHDSNSSTTSGIAPAVGKTSSSRVSRVTGSCNPYGGDFSSQQSQLSVPEGVEETEPADLSALPMNNRALALKQCEPPVRIGSRQVSMAEESAALGEDNTSTENSEVAESESSTDEAPPSMGVTSLRVLVKALVQQGKSQYLVIRNALQRPEYFGRALTREEKQTITDILNETMNEQDSAGNNRRGKENKSFSRSNSRGGSGAKDRNNTKVISRQSSRGVRRQTSRSLHTQLSRCNSNSDRPPLSRMASRGAGTERLTLTERMSTTDRLSYTTDRLSLNKQYSHMSSLGDDMDLQYSGPDSNTDQYSLFADEPMRVSDCLAPVNCP